MNRLRLDVWSDVACPWCYVGKRRLEAALARVSAPDRVDVVWRSFELDPAAPRALDPGQTYAERLARKYGSSVREAEAMIARMTETARADGLHFDFTRIRAGNTFDAHRVLHFAATRGRQGAMKERLLRAFFSEGEPIGDPDALARLAAEVGLDEEEVRAVLATDAHADEVRADEAEAARVGIRGVPFFVLGGRYAISGAQPAELLLGALERAFSELDAQPTMVAEGTACGPDGCD